MKSKIDKAFIAIRTLNNWPTLFVARLNRKFGTEVVLDTRMGPKIIVDVKNEEWLPVLEVFGQNIYTKFHNIKDSDVVVDIGANIGSFSVFASAKAKCKVYSFEPNPDVFQRLLKNISLNRASDKIIPLNIAMTDKVGRTHLFTQQDRGVDINTISGRVGQSANEGEVDRGMVGTFDIAHFINEYNIDNIDFLKMDCEGSEFDIISSVSSETLHKIKYMAMEYHNLEQRKLIHSKLENNGFMVYEEFGILYASR